MLLSTKVKFTKKISLGFAGLMTASKTFKFPEKVLKNSG